MCGHLSFLVSLLSVVTSKVISSVYLFIFWISLRDPIFEIFHSDVLRWMTRHEQEFGFDSRLIWYLCMIGAWKFLPAVCGLWCMVVISYRYYRLVQIQTDWFWNVRALKYSHLNTLLFSFNGIPWSTRFSNLFSLYLSKTRRTLRNNETWTKSSLLLVNPPDILSETESLDDHDINCANSLWWLCNCR